MSIVFRSSELKRYTIEPKCGLRIEIKKGQTITIKDVEGGQVADFFPKSKERTTNSFLPQ